MADNRDISPDQGMAPPFAKPEPKRGAIGTGDGYSGQEYDSVGQAEWRNGERALRMPPSVAVRGTGSPGEEIDPETAGSVENAKAGAMPDRGPTQE